MLTEKNIAIVKATAPILAEKGEELTRYFYKRMFSHNPDVLKLFNPAHQSTGTQQKALAGAICAYAANIDNLEALTNAVEIITQKHVSLRILPEHYPIVGENLLESIKAVLGDAATEDIVEAWKEAYFFLADILIGKEENIYKAQENLIGGWRGFKNFRVIKKVKESDVITSFYLEPEDKSSLPVFYPGQFITVRVPSPASGTTMRNYSLSDKPNQKHFRISVKREASKNQGNPEGYVSNFLHNKIMEGNIVELAPPSGTFYIDTSQSYNRPLVLLAAGIGITPLLSMLLESLEKNPTRKIVLIYASLNENTQAFKHTLDNLCLVHNNLTVHYRYSRSETHGVKRQLSKSVSEGFVDMNLVLDLVESPNADFYFCGPKPFMLNLYHGLKRWKVPESQIHFEFFGPLEDLETSLETSESAN